MFSVGPLPSIFRGARPIPVSPAGSRRLRLASAAVVLSLTAAIAGCVGAESDAVPLPMETAPVVWYRDDSAIKERDWPEAQEILDKAVEDFDAVGVDLRVWAQFVDGPFRGMTASTDNQEPVYAASAIKAPLMAAVYSDKLDTTVEVKAETIAGGSGVIQWTGETIATLLQCVAAYSDNAAANTLIDLVGKKGVNQLIKDAGINLADDHLGNKMYIPDPNGDRGSFSLEGAAAFMTAIQRAADGHGDDAVIDEAGARKMVHLLTLGAATGEIDSFSELVPTVSQKTGWTMGQINDHGIM